MKRKIYNELIKWKKEDQGARLDALVQAAVHRLQRRGFLGAGEGDRAWLSSAQEGRGGQRRQSAAGSACRSFIAERHAARYGRPFLLP